MNDMLDHDASITVACNMGYSTGMGILTELMCSNGTLSTPPPICYENCNLNAVPFSNHTMNDMLDHDASITVACNMGYSTGMGILTELMCSNGTLSTPPPICYENCNLNAVPFSNHTMNDMLDHDASITVACNMGYSTGMGILTELMCSNGTLSTPPPICYGKLLTILNKVSKSKEQDVILKISISKLFVFVGCATLWVLILLAN
ncbi:uncharacterized protein LOC135158057 [Lytechinus pictus]|uniref:uncharacterized protein LOC135158057 n=1 Tax=Lytechinus pictus TaxID=7653 RepID=UPI0030B9F0C9